MSNRNGRNLLLDEGDQGVGGALAHSLPSRQDSTALTGNIID